MSRFGAWIALGVMLCAAVALAQTQPSIQSSGLRVFLVTMGPGTEVWEKFGHDALIIRDDASGTEVAYNYGIFNFEQPNFIGRFILGRMLYSMDAMYAGPMVQAYIDDNREVIIQEMNLTAAQKQRLQDYLEWN